MIVLTADMTVAMSLCRYKMLLPCVKIDYELREKARGYFKQLRANMRVEWRVGAWSCTSSAMNVILSCSDEGQCSICKRINNAD